MGRAARFLFGYPSRVFSFRNIALVLGLAVAALAAYWGFAAWQKRSQFNAIADTVAEGTAQLRGSLTAAPTGRSIAAIEAAIERLQSMRVSRQIAFAGAAGTYLSAARTVILRRADETRIAPQAVASRDALAAHMGTPRGRNDDWIRRAAELKKRMDGDQLDLDRVLNALAELLGTFPEVEKPVLAFVDASYVLDEPTRAAALKRVQADRKHAADEIAKFNLSR